MYDKISFSNCALNGVVPGFSETQSKEVGLNMDYQIIIKTIWSDLQCNKYSMKIYYFLVYFNYGSGMACLERHNCWCALLNVILCAQVDNMGCSHNFLEGKGLFVCLCYTHIFLLILYEVCVNYNVYILIVWGVVIVGTEYTPRTHRPSQAMP